MTRPRSPYASDIERLAPGYDWRHIECFMRIEHSTLDHLSPQRFAAEVRIAKACVDECGAEKAELYAQSWGF